MPDHRDSNSWGLKEHEPIPGISLSHPEKNFAKHRTGIPPGKKTTFGTYNIELLGTRDVANPTFKESLNYKLIFDIQVDNNESVLVNMAAVDCHIVMPRSRFVGSLQFGSWFMTSYVLYFVTSAEINRTFKNGAQILIFR